MGSLSIWHWLIIAVVFVMFFGAKRLPGAARSLGQSLRIFKSEVSQMQSDSKDGKEDKSEGGAGAPEQAKQLPATSQVDAATAQPQQEKKLA
ncbi:Sec-independent protein translocase subunit TatA [Nocardia callitridis]|uniref:Sec-independent protein translocase protein TatA n=1 Tax=Nocardia callitridis TaxID=648753 RepID=A0ABP9K9Q1_9NOCA